jgi:predicted transposase YbfD/YdcC
MDYKAAEDFAQRVEPQSLASHFAAITDQRKQRGKRYPLAPLLVLIALAKLCGADKPVEIAEWVSARAAVLTQALGLAWKRMPHASTYRRLLSQAIRIEELEQQAREFIASRSEQAQEAGGEAVKVEAVKATEVLAIDGKSLRGTIPAGQTQGVHLLAIYRVSTCATLQQTAVERKENEISAAPRLIAQVAVRGQTVTGDAMLAQRKLSAQIVEAGGDYLWTVKKNHPVLYQDLELHFAAERLPAFAQAADFRTHTQLDKGHGRVEQRTLTASTGLNDYLDWPGLQQVFEIQRERFNCRTGETTTETVYGLTSQAAERASAACLLELNRSHWGIENGLHYRRDVTFGEDRCRIKSRTAAEALAVFNNLAIYLISQAGRTNAAQARRYYDGNIGEALRLILVAPG